MRALNIIIQREFMSRVNTRTFILTTLLTPILFIAIMVVPAILATLNKNDDIRKVYVIDKTDKYAALFESSDSYEFVILRDGESKPDEKATALLEIKGDLNADPTAVTFYSEKQQPPRELTSYINDKLTDAVRNQKIEDFTRQNDIEPLLVSDMQQILKSKDRIQVSSIRWDETGQEQKTMGEIASLIGLVLTFLMFFFIMMYGSMVMQSVVEEKSNRIIEVIISSVRPFDLMMGKIVGVGLVGLLQLIIWFVIGGGAMIAVQMYFGINMDMASSADVQHAMAAMQNNSDLNASLTELFSVNWLQIAICFILYFIGGYLLFSSLYAMFGSAANDSQEVQQLMMPMTILLFIAFYSGTAAARNPEGAMAFWCSLIPFTSPVVMMVRAPFEIPIWELIVSVILLITTAVLAIKLAAKIYRVGILMTGKKASFVEIFKWLNYK
ncbi:MAG: ABC transporter permease [Dysgonomonas sp.]